MAKLFLLIVCSAASLALFATTLPATPDVWGTGYAWQCNQPGYEGYWEYCYEVYWSGLPHGVSHVDVLLCLLADCECLCEPGYFAFADTVGSGPGTPNGSPCTVYYYAEFECRGDPSIDLWCPLIKFEPYENHCEPDKDGWMTACFLSVAAPIPVPEGRWIAIKFGTSHAFGILTGVLPGCNSAYSETDQSSWGHIKALYR